MKRNFEIGSTQTMSPAVIRKAGLEAVAKKLGPVGMVRFLQPDDTISFGTNRGRMPRLFSL